MLKDVERVLIDRHAIARRVEQLAGSITRDFDGGGFRGGAESGGEDASGDAAGVSPGGHEITLVPILTGSIIFVADLIRHLPLRMKIRLISVSSYPGATTVSKGVRLREHLNTLPESLAGAHVLVIDDILDSGKTLGMVTGQLRDRGPATLRTCVLLRKQRPEAMSFPVEYVCFDIPDEFVVGYGLDYNDYYRNLPDVVTLRRDVIEREAQVA